MDFKNKYLIYLPRDNRIPRQEQLARLFLSPSPSPAPTSILLSSRTAGEVLSTLCRCLHDYSPLHCSRPPASPAAAPSSAFVYTLLLFGSKADEIVFCICAWHQRSRWLVMHTTPSNGRFCARALYSHGKAVAPWSNRFCSDHFVRLQED